MSTFNFLDHFSDEGKQAFQDRLAVLTRMAESAGEEITRLELHTQRLIERLKEKDQADAEESEDRSAHKHYAEHAWRLNERRRRQASWKEQATALEKALSTLRRLLQDSRMEEAHRLLREAFRDQSTETIQRCLENFVDAAWSSHFDAEPYRAEIDAARTLSRKKLAPAAKKLADLLREAQGSPILPDAFRRLDALLRTSDSASHFPRWTELRPELLGDAPTPEDAASDGGLYVQSVLGSLLGESMKPVTEPSAETEAAMLRVNLISAWQSAPLLPELMDHLASLAETFEPVIAGDVGAARRKRQRNLQTEYYRAFAHTLVEKFQFAETAPTLDPKIICAMAVAATVIFDEPDLVVTSNDIRATL